jgi:predicted XRE-type DNA-binding protein
MRRRTGQLDHRLRVRNRHRFREEVTEGIRHLMQNAPKRTQTWLATRLGVSRSRVCQVLEGSDNNFQLDTLADLALALNRGVHIVFGVNTDEMRLAQDEGEKAVVGTSLSLEEPTIASDTPDTLNFMRYLKAARESGAEASTTALTTAPDPVAAKAADAA